MRAAQMSRRAVWKVWDWICKALTLPDNLVWASVLNMSQNRFFPWLWGCTGVKVLRVSYFVACPLLLYHTGFDSCLPHSPSKCMLWSSNYLSCSSDASLSPSVTSLLYVWVWHLLENVINYKLIHKHSNKCQWDGGQQTGVTTGEPLFHLLPISSVTGALGLGVYSPCSSQIKREKSKPSWLNKVK